jgi:hypothetical protein
MCMRLGKNRKFYLNFLSVSLFPGFSHSYFPFLLFPPLSLSLSSISAHTATFPFSLLWSYHNHHHPYPNPIWLPDSFEKIPFHSQFELWGEKTRKGAGQRFGKTLGDLWSSEIRSSPEIQFLLYMHIYSTYVDSSQHCLHYILYW